MIRTADGRTRRSTPGTPLHTQRVEAARRGNLHMMMRAQLKRDIANGTANAADYVRHPPQFALSMDTVSLVSSVPGLGRVKALKALRRVPVYGNPRVGELTADQRATLARLLED